MFKKLIHLKDDFYYSPSHNAFFKTDSPNQVNYEHPDLAISGREEIVFEYLLSRYNNGITVTREELESEFPEIKRAYDKILDRLKREKIEGKLGLHNLIIKERGMVKIGLAESPFTISENISQQILPLLKRPGYKFDYGRIFSDYASDNTDNPRSILLKWIEECEKASSYDQKCIIILENFGFLPAFGQKSDKNKYLNNVKSLIDSFKESDRQAHGGTELLFLARNVIFAVIEYIEAQNEIIDSKSDTDDLRNKFDKMLQSFLSINISDILWINPLLLAVYYHYLGLVYYRNYLYNGNKNHLIFALEAIEKAIQNAQKVDQQPEVWKAFLNYDLARIYFELDDNEKAIEKIQIALEKRENLFNYSLFSDSVKQQLYFEYLLAKIIETDIKKKAQSISENDAQAEYTKIKSKAETITNFETRLYIRHLLENRMENKDKER